MGVKSTMFIERADAIREVLAHIQDVSDDDLETILEYVLGEQARFLNFIVGPVQDRGPECYFRGRFK